MYEWASLLVDEHPLQVLPSLATAIGLNESIFIQQLHYWLQQKSHLKDGYFWVYNTMGEWQLQFPFWSERTIRRTVKSLKDQGLINTTDKYNRSSTDRRLWYAIEYENLQKIRVKNGVDFTRGQCGRLDLDNVAVSTGQYGRLDLDNVAVSTGQHGRLDAANLSGSLYGTETTTETTAETTTEITTTTTTFLDLATTPCDPQPEDVVVVVLSTHGLSSPIARRFAQKYPQEYLFEKVEFLKFEQTRTPDLANPAGWLRRAIEENFAKPPGFQTASEIEAEQAAQAQREAAALAVKQAKRQARVKAEMEREKAAAVAEAEAFAAKLALVQPSYGTTEALLRAWEEGVSYVARLSLGNVQMLMDGLRKTVLLTFEAGHAQIGVWDGPTHYALQLRGKQFLKECLAYAMRDTLEGGSGTYELILLDAEQSA